MSNRTVPQYRVGDIVKLRKRHPCGCYTWLVWRKGADIGIECTSCKRRLMMERHEFEKYLKGTVAEIAND